LEISRKWKFCIKKRSLLQGACREMSSSATTAEKREVHASGLLLRLLCRAGAQPRLLSAICIHSRREATSVHFPTCALQQKNFLVQKLTNSSILD